jgi:hypothetical protein
VNGSELVGCRVQNWICCDRWYLGAGPDPQSQSGEPCWSCCSCWVCMVALRATPAHARDNLSTTAGFSQALAAPPMQASHAIGRGPRAALRAWSSDRRTVDETNAWMEEARIQAILGGCGRSLASVKSVCFMIGGVCMLDLSVSQVRHSVLHCFRQGNQRHECCSIPAKARLVACLGVDVSLQWHLQQLFGLCQGCMLD